MPALKPTTSSSMLRAVVTIYTTEFLINTIFAMS